MTHTMKESLQNLIESLGKKINDNFVSDVIIQKTNERSRRAAGDLWQSIDERERDNTIDIQSYTNLMDTLSSFLRSDSLQVLLRLVKNFVVIDICRTWGQENFAISSLCLLLQNHVPIPLTCIEIFVRSLLHENIDLRKV